MVKNARRCKRHRFDPWVGEMPWRRKWQPTPVFLPEKSHRQRSLVGYNPKGCKELDTTKHSTSATLFASTVCTVVLVFALLGGTIYCHCQVSRVGLSEKEFSAEMQLDRFPSLLAPYFLIHAPL